MPLHGNFMWMSTSESHLHLQYGFYCCERRHDHGESSKGKHLIEGAAYSFTGLVNYHHGEGHFGKEADMVLKKMLHVVTSCCQQEVYCLTGCGLSIYKTSKLPSTVI